MPYNRTIAPERASGELAELYRRIAGARGGVADIHQVQSLTRVIDRFPRPLNELPLNECVIELDRLFMSPSRTQRMDGGKITICSSHSVALNSTRTLLPVAPTTLNVRLPVRVREARPCAAPEPCRSARRHDASAAPPAPSASAG